MPSNRPAANGRDWSLFRQAAAGEADIGASQQRRYDLLMETRPRSVGLGGDGDEISAIEEVEAEFNVTLDYTNAYEWATAGDVYAALCMALPAGEADQPDVWDRFARALCRETGISPSDITRESELLSEGGIWVHVANGSAALWIAIAILAVAGIGWLLS